MNAGIQIAQRGSLIAVDETARSVPAESRSLFFPQYVGQPYYSPRFMGFFLLDPAAGTVVDQFPHLYPTAIAIGYSIEGLTGARDAGLIAAALGVLALYFLGTRLAGPAAGAAAAGLLAINVIEVWYARYPNSEMLTQALGLTGLLAVARAHVDDDAFFAPVAGIILGLLPFARFDAVLVSGLVVAAVVLQWLAGDRLRLAFLFPLAFGTALFVVYLVGWLAPYAVLPRIFVTHHRIALGVAFGAGVVVLAAAAWFRRSPAIRRLVIAWAPRLLLSVAVVLAGYAWFLRQPGGSLPAHDAYSLRAFGWYVPPAAIGAAVIGLALLMTRRFWTDPSFFVVFVGIGLFVFDHLRIVPEHFWAARRFVPIILPGTMLPSAPCWRRRTGHGGSTAGRLAFAGRQACASCCWRWWRGVSGARHVRSDRTWSTRASSRNSNSSPRDSGTDDLLVVESRNASDLHVLALPLAYTYGKQVLLLSTPRPDSLRFAQFLRWARGDASQRVFPRGRRHGPALARGGGGGRFGGAVPGARVTVASGTATRRTWRRKEFDFGIYRSSTRCRTRRPGRSNRRRWTTSTSSGSSLRSVTGTARSDGGRAQSDLSLAGVDADVRGAGDRMERRRTAAAGDAGGSGGLPRHYPRLEKSSSAANGSPTSSSIPPALAAEAGAAFIRSLVRLVSTTLEPASAHGASNDNRDLGVMVDRVEVPRGSRCAEPLDVRRSGHPEHS